MRSAKCGCRESSISPRKNQKKNGTFRAAQREEVGGAPQRRSAERRGTSTKRSLSEEGAQQRSSSIIHPSIHPFNHLSVCSCIGSLKHRLTIIHSFINSWYSCIYMILHAFTDSLTHRLTQLMHWVTHSFTQWFTYSLTHWFTFSLVNWFILSDVHGFIMSFHWQLHHNLLIREWT